MREAIVYCGGFELPDFNAAAHRVMSNTKILINLGYQVYLLGLKKNNVENLTINKNIHDVSINYPNSTKKWLKYIFSISDYIAFLNTISNLKYIICYNLPAIKTLKLKKYCASKDIRVIGDITEFYGFQGKNLLWKIVKYFDSILRMKYVNRKINGIIVISRFLEKFYNTNNTILIPPLVDLSENKWNIVSEDNTAEPIKFIYSGSPGKNKDNIYLIYRIFNSLSLPFTLDIVGISQKIFQDENNVKKNEISTSIRFHGRISHQKAISILAQSDYSIFLRNNSRTNNAGFPTKFVESISLGVPVITNNTSNIHEYIHDGHNGFIFSELSEKNLIEKMNYILSNNIRLKNKFNNRVFDFRNYINEFKIFLEKIHI